MGTQFFAFHKKVNASTGNINIETKTAQPDPLRPALRKTNTFHITNAKNIKSIRTTPAGDVSFFAGFGAGAGAVAGAGAGVEDIFLCLGIGLRFLFYFFSGS
jgi:hypothetical protein